MLLHILYMDLINLIYSQIMLNVDILPQHPEARSESSAYKINKKRRYYTYEI